MSDYKISNMKLFKYNFIKIDKFSNYTLCKPIKNKNAQTLTDDFKKILIASYQKPIKIESDR